MLGHRALSNNKFPYCQLNIHVICGVQKPKGDSSVTYYEICFSYCEKQNIAQTEANIPNGSNTLSTTTISYKKDIPRKKKNVELKAICKENNLRIGSKKRSNRKEYSSIPSRCN